MSFIHKFKNRASWQSLGLEGSTVSGKTSPTLPTSEIAAVCRRSIKVRLIKSARGLHDKLFLKCSEGGRSELYCFPLKLPEKQPGSVKRIMAGSPSFSPRIIWSISP